jgi:Predicted transcriptional regulators
MKNLTARINCPVGTFLDLIGGKYKALILWHLMHSTLRFGEIQKLIPQSTPKMLTQQLRELEKDKLVRRKVYPVVPPKVEYSLTKLGVSLEPTLRSMFSWGSKYLEDNGKTVNCSMASCCDK